MYTNKMDNKKYIGITSRTMKERAGSNGCRYKKCTHFYRAIEKYGWHNFVGEILLQNLTKQEAEEKEKEYIDMYNTMNPDIGYNVCDGGGLPPLMKGELNPFYNHTHSDKTKRIIAESNKRRIWTDDAKKSISEKMSRGKSPCARKIICLETNDIFDCIKDAAEKIGVTPSKICDVLKGRHKTSKGFHFIYYDAVL